MAEASVRRRLLLWAPFFSMLVVQVYLSSRSRLPPLLPFLPGGDKLLHAGWFFFLALLAYRAAREGEGWTRRRTTLALLLGALVWGTLDELHQSRVPGRAVEAADVAADLAGAALAALAAEPLLRRLKLVATPD